MRTFGIWFFGLIAGMLIGGLVGNHLNYSDGAFFGIIAGMAVFACARLWLAGR